VSSKINNIQRGSVLVFYIHIFMLVDGLEEGPKHVALLTQTINCVMLYCGTFINIESRHNGMKCN